MSWFGDLFKELKGKKLPYTDGNEPKGQGQRFYHPNEPDPPQEFDYEVEDGEYRYTLGEGYELDEDGNVIRVTRIWELFGLNGPKY